MYKLISKLNVNAQKRYFTMFLAQPLATYPQTVITYCCLRGLARRAVDHLCFTNSVHHWPPLLHSLVNIWGQHGEHITSLPQTPLAATGFSQALHLAQHQNI